VELALDQILPANVTANAMAMALANNATSHGPIVVWQSANASTNSSIIIWKTSTNVETQLPTNRVIYKAD